MKKNVLIFGTIAGLIAAGFMAVTIAICYNSARFEANMWLGYGSMLVAFSFIFVGIKNYRDKFNGGYITFGQAFKTGLLIALIGSTFYVATWLVEYYFFIPDFMEKYSAHEIARATHSGASLADINQTRAQMANYTKMYKNPLMVIAFTYWEIFPVGLTIAAIAALILKRRDGNMQTAAVAQ